MTHRPLPVALRGDLVAVSLKVAPKASQNRIQGLAADAAGGTVLRVAVTAAPEKGKANQAVIRLLAKALAVPKTSLTVISGETDRHKVIGFSGDTTALKHQIESWLRSLPQP
ncbi:MAG: DUF167 family protein [Alphaproteobacteria bacterium]